MTHYLLAQAPPVDPYSQYGVLGALLVVIAALLGLHWRLFVRSGESQAANLEKFLTFMKEHRGETTMAMERLAAAVSTSGERTAAAISTSNERSNLTLDRMGRSLQTVLMQNTVLENVERAARAGSPMTAEMIRQTAQTVIQEMAVRDREAGRG